MLRATDVIMIGQTDIINNSIMFIKTCVKDVFYHSIINPGAVQCPCAGGFQPITTKAILKHQQPMAGLVILFGINTSVQDMGNGLFRMDSHI